MIALSYREKHIFMQFLDFMSNFCTDTKKLYIMYYCVIKKNIKKNKLSSL